MDISVAYNRYKFLGHEFLTWLWFEIENHPLELKASPESEGALYIGNKIIIENHQDNRSETLSIKGHHADFNEGLLALKKGALVTELHLVYQEDRNKWQFTIKGENINFLNIKHPDIGPVETPDDTEGFVLEKIYHLQKPMALMDDLFKKFLRLRLSNNWLQNTLPRIKKWIRSSASRDL